MLAEELVVFTENPEAVRRGEEQIAAHKTEAEAAFAPKQGVAGQQ